jgi:hypothetical protein
LTPALAVPSEGFEVLGFSNAAGKSKSALKTFVFRGQYINPVWASDYENAQVYTSLPVLGGNYLTAGYSVTAGNKLSDRSAYFLRYDQTFWGQSISAKLLHIDERFLGTGKNILSLDYNGAFSIGKTAQLFLTLGAYSRYGLNQWDTNQTSPLNFNTVDREYYIEAILGGRIPFSGGKSFATIDINTRDAFNSYNADFVAFDASLNFGLGQNFTWNLASSTRFTSMFMGTADIGSQTFTFGFTSSL